MKISQEKINYIKEHLDTPNNKLAEILKIDRHTVGKYKKEFGFTSKKDFHAYDNYIINSYYTKTSIELANEIGCSKSYVCKVWTENDLKGKGTFRYYCNKDYFEKIDSCDKAYILGFIASDGCLYKREGHQGLLQISIHEKDLQILEDIKNRLNSTHPILKNNQMRTLSIVSDKIFEDLGKIGLHPKKTWEIDIEEVMNNIPSNLHRDFIRGYFDGDGSISSSDNYKTNAQYSIKIAVPETTGIKLEKILLKHNIQTTFYIDQRKESYSKSFGWLDFGSILKKYCFLKWIYSNNTLALDRKKKIALQFIERVENNITNRSENIKAVEHWQKIKELI